MTPGAAEQTPGQHLASVLVVEDDNALREFLCVALAQDFRVDSTVSGLEALELTRRLRPDVVVLDVMLPGLNGLEVVRQIRSDPRLRDTPVLVMTAFSDIEPSEALAAGASRFLSKPFDVGELVETIRDLL